MTINFKEVPQSSFLWVPPVARAYIPRNSLYPFKTYLGAQQLGASLWLFAGLLLAFWLAEEEIPGKNNL